MEDYAYVFKKHVWVASITKDIDTSYGYFRISAGWAMTKTPPPSEKFKIYASTKTQEELNTLSSKLIGKHRARIYLSDGFEASWVQTALNTTFNLVSGKFILFEGYPTEKIAVDDILAACNQSDLTTVNGATISGNAYTIVYDVKTGVINVYSSGTYKYTNMDEIVLFAVYFNSFVDGAIVDAVVRKKYESNTARLKTVETAIAGETTLPDYWLTYLGTKIRDVQAKDILIGANGDSFIFCTDQHYPTNTGHAPELIKYVMSHSSVSDLVMGGDLINGSSVSKATAVNALVDARNKYIEFKPKYLRGNHDSNTEISGATPELAISDNELYGVLLKPIENDIVADKQMFYYYNNEVQKIRYICLDTGHPDTHVLSDAQITWMQSKITELSADWTVVVFTHQFFASGAQSRDGNGDKILAGLDAIYNTADAVIACVICGHNHIDASAVSDKGYPIIGVTCELRQGEASDATRTAGTYAEDAFDVFHIDTANRHIYATRIGFNVDRDWTY